MHWWTSVRSQLISFPLGNLHWVALAIKMTANNKSVKGYGGGGPGTSKSKLVTRGFSCYQKTHHSLGDVSFASSSSWSQNISLCPSANNTSNVVYSGIP